MSTQVQPTIVCPKCQGPLWDNRASKRNPKAPDYKCRDTKCDGVIWPPKNGQRSPVSAPPANAPQGFSAGPHVPAIDGPRTETGAPPGEPEGNYDKLERLLFVYDKCWTHAVALARKDLGNDASHEGMSAMTATLLIQACQLRIVQ